MQTPRIVYRNGHSATELVVHASWSTAQRAPLLGEDFDPWLRHAAPRVVRGARVLAIGNGDDHVHVVLRFVATCSVADLVGPLKGALSHRWNESHAATLRWQAGYWAATCWPDDLDALLSYVHDQRAHHRAGTVRPEFESPLGSSGDAVW